MIELHHQGQSQVVLRRAGCCPNYRLPGREKCDTCCLRSLDERVEIARQRLATGEPVY